MILSIGNKFIFIIKFGIMIILVGFGIIMGLFNLVEGKFRKDKSMKFISDEKRYLEVCE